MDWSASQYGKFEAERTRPACDLLAQIATATATTAVDLGCGPGNSTALLQARFPTALVTGIDSSFDMIATARRRLPNIRFERDDIVHWSGLDSAETVDIILANAALQWLPDHASLLPALLARLAPGGTLAVQMPDNLDEPAHRLMASIAAEPPFAAAYGSTLPVRPPLAGAAWYYALLRAAASRVDVWRTTYLHPLAGGADGLVEWFKGSGLRPFLARLDEPGRVAFLARYRDALEHAYPALPDGTVLLPFPRLFIVAERGAARSATQACAAATPL